MNALRRFSAAFGLAAVMASTPAAVHAAENDSGPTAGEPSVSILSSCGDSRKVTLGYWPSYSGEAYWKVTCSGGKTTIRGWHKDLKADGDCVQVYGSVGSQSFYTPKACPKGERESWTRTLSGTSNIKVYARLV
ncbi:PNPOx family protein [Salininema proteolyticum]|uniref:Uncharacterized protein n=1 Tax=Salininema proteolyticum TaxID=1607685 RepID=A0ABV8TV77_9ACTN